MDLKFILSLGFDQVSFSESDCNGLGVFLYGRNFDVHNGQVRSGIFNHRQFKKIFLVIYEDNIFVGFLGDDGFVSYVELRTAMVCYDKKLYERIVKMTIKEYTE